MLTEARENPQMCLYVYRLNQLELMYGFVFAILHVCTLLCMSVFVHAQVSVCFCTLRLSTITRLSHSHHLTSSSIQTLHNFLIIQPTSSVVMKGPQPQRETEKHTHTKRSELPTKQHIQTTVFILYVHHKSTLFFCLFFYCHYL